MKNKERNMFFGLLGGFFGMGWLANFFANYAKKYPIKIDDLSDDLFNSLLEIEEGGEISVDAYSDSRGIATIGCGITYFYSKTGVLHTQIKSWHTLSYLKKKYGYTGMSDRSFVKMMVSNYFKTTNMQEVLDEINLFKIPYNDYLISALMDFRFNSGGAFNMKYNTNSSYLYRFRVYYPLFAMFTRSAEYDSFLAKIYVGYRLHYLKDVPSYSTNWGWLKRVAFCGDRIKGTKKPFSYYSSMKKAQIKKYILDEFGVIA